MRNLVLESVHKCGLYRDCVYHRTYSRTYSNNGHIPPMVRPPWYTGHHGIQATMVYVQQIWPDHSETPYQIWIESAENWTRPLRTDIRANFELYRVDMHISTYLSIERERESERARVRARESESEREREIDWLIYQKICIIICNQLVTMPIQDLIQSSSLAKRHTLTIAEYTVYSPGKVVRFSVPIRAHLTCLRFSCLPPGQADMVGI
jgi:hypothetical protein